MVGSLNSLKIPRDNDAGCQVDHFLIKQRTRVPEIIKWLNHTTQNVFLIMAKKSFAAVEIRSRYITFCEAHKMLSHLTLLRCDHGTTPAGRAASFEQLLGRPCIRNPFRGAQEAQKIIRRRRNF